MAKVWNILGYLIILMLLFIISFVNIEEIYNLYLNNIYVFLYFIFLFCSLFFYLFGGIKKKIKSKEFLYIIQFILFFCILLIPGILINHYFLLESLGQNNLYLRVYGKIAFFYFAFALIISPILEFVKNNILRENLILTRKILGILSFIFFLKHGLEYFALEYIFQTQYYINTPYLDYVIKNLLVRYDALSGVISGILMLILGLTSNKFSVKFLGKKWKKMQSLVFPAFLISAIHVAFASRFESFYIFLISLVVITRLIAYLNRKQRRNSGKIIGYICIPCGYIYDEKIGDLDSGILPGTKFEDIPNNWKCPVCGVTKDDFEPIYEGEEIREKAKIIGYKMLTKDVLELKIKVLNLDKIEVNPGQFAKITMFDKIGDFTRSYSVVKQKDNLLTFGIKLKEGGRGGELLKKSKIGDILIFSGISGKFVLKNTKNPKIFIATGTGLSPIINMITGGLQSENNYLFFGVEKQKDLFYLDEISKIKKIKIEIFLSREKVDSYNFGRIDLLKYDFTKNIEFYICGNPGLVESLKKDLNNKGFKDIFTEEF